MSSKKALVGNAADPQQVKEAEQKERFERREEEKDLAFLLSTKPGQRFLWKVLEFCGVFNGGYQEPNQLMFRAGERNVGVWLLSQITEADSEALITMMKRENENA